MGAKTVGQKTFLAGSLIEKVIINGVPNADKLGRVRERMYEV